MSTAQGSQQHIYRFGNCVIDAARHELHRDGELVELQPKVFDLLLYLASHHERVIDKDELQDAVWPGMFITETALTRAVMKARKAVGDEASRQEIIRTVHGKGYRFVATLLPDDAIEVPSAQQAEETPARKRLALFWLSVAAAVSLLALAAAFLLFRPAAVSDQETRIAVLPLQDDTGDTELAWMRLGLMSYVSRLIESDGGLAVVDDGNVVSLVNAFGDDTLGSKGVNAELSDKLTRAYGATHILTMQLEGQGGNLRMNYSLLGPGGSVQRGTMVGNEGTELAQGVVQSLYGILFRRARTGSFDLVSEDPFNNEAYARGMDLSLQGRCAEALSFFRIVMDQEPGLFAPRYEYAACARVLGENEEAESLLNALIEEQHAFGDTRLLAQAYMTRGILYNRTGRLDEAQASHEEALSLAEEIGDHTLAGRIRQNLSIVYEDRGDFSEADNLLNLAMLDYQAAGVDVLPGQIWSARANLRMDTGELAEAREYLDRAIAAFREVGDLRNEALIYNNTGYLLREMGSLKEAETYHTRSLEIRKDIGDRVGVGRVYGQLSALYSALGRFGNAVDAARNAWEVAVDTKDRLFEATALAQWADAEIGLGQFESARSHLEESRAVFEEIQDRMRVMQVDVLLASLDLRTGALESAESMAANVAQAAQAAGYIQPQVEAMELLGEVALARPDLPVAIARFTDTLDVLKEASWGSKETELLVHLLGAHLDAGNLDEAAPLAGDLSGREATVASLVVQARFAGVSGDSALATELLSRAKTLAGERWTAENEAQLAAYQAEN